jgi:hypothetical protein
MLYQLSYQAKKRGASSRGRTGERIENALFYLLGYRGVIKKKTPGVIWGVNWLPG